MDTASEKLVLDILRLVHENRTPATAAIKRLEERARVRLNEMTEHDRACAKETAALLEVAREQTLDPTKIGATSGVQFVKGQDGFEDVMVQPGTEIRWWMNRARELGVVVTPETGRRVAELRFFIEQAREWGLDIDQSNGPDCFLFVRRGQLGRAGKAEQDFRAEVYPEHVAQRWLPMEFLLDQMFEAECVAEHDKPRTGDEWWELAVLFLLLHLPDFDGSTIGISSPIPWKRGKHEPEYGFGRFQYRKALLHGQEAHDTLLRRTFENLRAIAETKLGKRAKEPAGKSGPTAPKGFIFRKDASEKYDVPVSTLWDWGKSHAELQADRDPNCGRHILHESSLRALVKKKNRSKN